MKFVTFLIIGGVAVVMGWLWFQPDCAGGAIASNEDECVSIKGFDRAFCARAFARPEEAIFAAGNAFATQSDCLKRFVDCVAMPKPVNWSPKPSGFCVVRGITGNVQRMVPYYGPRSGS